jgi:hypothetical protein
MTANNMAFCPIVQIVVISKKKLLEKSNKYWKRTWIWSIRKLRLSGIARFTLGRIHWGWSPTFRSTKSIWRTRQWCRRTRQRAAEGSHSKAILRYLSSYRSCEAKTTDADPNLNRSLQILPACVWRFRERENRSGYVAKIFRKTIKTSSSI